MVLGESGVAFATDGKYNTCTPGQTNPMTVIDHLRFRVPALPANSACANWLVAPPPPSGSGTTGTSYIQSMLQNTAFGHGVFNSITTWAFTGLNGTTGVPNGIAMVTNDQAGFYKASAPNGAPYVWGPSSFIYTEFDPVANTPILTPPQYQGGSLKAQVATLIHETAHGIQVEFFQNDTGIQKAGNYSDQFLYQNCHGLIDGIQ